MFLSDNAALFGLESGPGRLPGAVAMIREQELPGATKITYEQTVGGLPVADAQISIIVNSKGSVTHVTSTVQVIASVDTVPTLTVNDAITRATASLGGLRLVHDDQSPRLCIFPAASPRLAYEIYLTVDAGYEEPWRLVIDAHDGSILWRRRLVADQSQVFDPNPVATLNDETLHDQNDANAAVPLTAYFPVTLAHLDPPVGGLYQLKGLYVWMQNIESPANLPPTSEDGTFPYLRFDDGFEEVMVYYTIDQNQTYIQGLSFNNIDNRQHRFDAHGFNGDDNSHYVGSPIGSGYITYGDGGVDDAEDADIILHEYGHSIQDNSTHGIYFGYASNGYGDETGAMGEGFGDYWAASGGYDSSVAHSFPLAYVGEWDAKGYSPGGDPYLRVVNTAKVYPADMVNEIHSDGEIWSATLWDIFQQLGRTVTDRIVLYSHFLVPVNPDFADGANALLAADAALYPAATMSGASTAGVHRAQICSVLSARGILTCPPTCDCTLHGDPNGDSSINILDIAFTIDEAFSNGQKAPQDPLCPHLSRSDDNCDRQIDVLDIIYVIDFVFSGGPAPCDPCAM